MKIRILFVPPGNKADFHVRTDEVFVGDHLDAVRKKGLSEAILEAVFDRWQEQDDVRSLAAGDLVKVGGRWWIAEPVGWRKVDDRLSPVFDSAAEHLGA